MKFFVRENIENISKEELQRMLDSLPVWRRQKVEACRLHAGRCQGAAAFLLLQQALREEYGLMEIPPFVKGEHGKPFLQEFPHIHFNLSHCRRAVVCAVDDAPVGVDVETPRRVSAALLRYTMNEQEVKQILSAENPPLAFSTLWTCKEAVLKLTGEGVGSRMHDVLRPEGLQEKGIGIVTRQCDGFVYSVACCLSSKHGMEILNDR